MRLMSLLTLLLIISPFAPAPAADARSAKDSTRTAGTANSTATEQEVLRDFDRILDLWRDGRYDDLYQRTAGKGSREQFAERLAAGTRKPACCWEKMQEATVSLKGPRAAVLRARLGFEGGMSGTEFVTGEIDLKKGDGFWTISRSELMTLAKVSNKRARYKYLPMQGSSRNQ